MNVARAFCDPRYREYGFTNGFAITAGKHHLNGNQALAYARVRKAAGESDFTRAARQQEVLSGIRDRVVKGGFVNDPIGLLRARRQDRHDQRPAQAAARPGRRGHEDRPQRHVSGGDHAPAGGVGRTTRAARSRSRTSRRSAALAADLFPTDGALPGKKSTSARRAARRPRAGAA